MVFSSIIIFKFKNKTYHIILFHTKKSVSAFSARQSHACVACGTHTNEHTSKKKVLTKYHFYIRARMRETLACDAVGRCTLSKQCHLMHVRTATNSRTVRACWECRAMRYFLHTHSLSVRCGGVCVLTPVTTWSVSCGNAQNVRPHTHTNANTRARNEQI